MSPHTSPHLLRPEVPADHAAVRAVHLSAFPTDEEADLVDLLRRDVAWVDGLSWVAVDNDEVIAHALLTRCHIDDAPSLALAPVAVRPEWQRQGFGAMVTRACLEAARTAGESSVVVLGHPEYYPRFGFSTASEHGVSVSFPVPDEALMVLSLDGSPLPRGVVGYADTFGI